MSICGAGVYDCQLICRFSDNGGSIADFNGLLDYCRQSSNSSFAHIECVSSYMTNCQLYVPFSSFSSSSSQRYSSTSFECPSGNNDFSYENLKNGFSDYYEYFFILFSCFILVKLIWMAK